jgi:hypothetical protein
VPSVEESFESPRLLLSSAREDFNRLNSLFEAFFRDNPYRLGVDRKPNASKAVFCAEIIKKPTAEMRLLTYSIVNDLRNALDQAVYGASSALGQTSLDNVHFPFRDSPRDFERVFTGKGRCSDVPVELHGILRSFEPYPTGNAYSGGDDRLIHLNRLANPNKHRVALRIQLVVRGLVKVHVVAAPDSIRIPPPRWNSTKDKLSLFEIIKTTDYTYDINLDTFVALSEPPLDGESVEGFIRAQIAKVESIIDRLERETRKIIQARLSP